jgi:hypothetical protein
VAACPVMSAIGNNSGPDFAQGELFAFRPKPEISLAHPVLIEQLLYQRSFALTLKVVMAGLVSGMTGESQWPLALLTLHDARRYSGLENPATRTEPERKKAFLRVDGN